MTYPDPEEFERQRRRLDKIRPWAQAVGAGIFGVLLVGIYLFFFG
ncbi:MAG TPA: hypothetical protein PKY87_14360 [Terricaulis sp.]|nr:hypothetical protein [Terricaulis sp.]